MAPSPDPPSLQQVRALPEIHRQVVPAEYEDYNGHMSIHQYMAIHAEAGPALLEKMGLSDEHRARRRSSIFDAEHHLLFFGEVMVGDTVSVHDRILGRSQRAVHGISFLVNVTREQVANTLEWISIHVGLDSRRPEPWPEELAATLDELIAEDRRLGWAPPLCGSMGVGSRS